MSERKEPVKGRLVWSLVWTEQMNAKHELAFKYYRLIHQQKSK